MVVEKKYEHMYSIGFSVQTDGEEATVEEMWEGLNKRLNDLKRDPKEIWEAAGMPDDITENDQQGDRLRVKQQ